VGRTPGWKSNMLLFTNQGIRGAGDLEDPISLIFITVISALIFISGMENFLLELHRTELA